MNNITSDATVGASTVYSGYPAILAVDGDLSTSWFSTGPEPPDQSSTYTWTAARAVCIGTIAVRGNGLNDTPAFRTGFGFESVTIRVFDTDGDVVFEEDHDLAGTPDPDLVTAVNLLAARVELVFAGHESPDSGGFAELEILGG
jgi:hypothetical protein